MVVESPECMRAILSAVRSDLQLKKLQETRDKAIIDIDNRLKEIQTKIRNIYKKNLGNYDKTCQS